MDIDHFKQLDDGPGHAAGDQVLAATAARLTQWAAAAAWWAGSGVTSSSPNY